MDSKPSPELRDLVVRRALDLFARDPKRRWTVETIAEAVGVSRAALARRFVAALGEPPLRALTRMRMEHAGRLLATTDDGLVAIADAVGYDSEFAFSRAFKRARGVPPAVFRRDVRSRAGFTLRAAA
jgi:transcriptional regulator GlxA family with amidase domain